MIQPVHVLKLENQSVGGFKGGMSAIKYMKIADTSKATATRDLQDLVIKNIYGKRRWKKYRIRA